jgi:hypothetical protein
VLPPRIEEEARSGLDREPEAQVLRARAHGFDFAGLQVIRIELPDVGRDRDAFVSEVVQHPHRIEDAVVREAVRVVGEPGQALVQETVG